MLAGKSTFWILLHLLKSRDGYPLLKLPTFPDDQMQGFRNDEVRNPLDCILFWQTDCADQTKPLGTFGNGATKGELRTLAHELAVTKITPIGRNCR